MKRASSARHEAGTPPSPPAHTVVEQRLDQEDVTLEDNQEDLTGVGRWEGKGQVEDDKFHSVMSN